MSSVQPTWDSVTNAQVPANFQAAVIRGTIDYTARDVGQWQPDGSVIINFGQVLAANPNFYPQSLILVNANGYSVPVSVNPGTLNYRITVPAGSIVRDLCLAFTSGLSIQFGSLANQSAPLEYIITNFPLVPETISLFNPTGGATNVVTGLQSISEFSSIFSAYTNTTNSIQFVQSAKLVITDLWDDANAGSFGIAAQNSGVAIDYEAVSWDTSVQTVEALSLSPFVLLPGDYLAYSLVDGSLPTNGSFRVVLEILPLVFNL